MYVAGRMLFAVVIALVSLSAMSLQRDDQSANDTEIRIGNLMPYTGPLAEFSTIGKAEAAYFDDQRPRRHKRPQGAFHFL